MNLHAAALRSLLLERGVHVVNVGNAWKVLNGRDRLVTYWPGTGDCAFFDGVAQKHRLQELRGSPERVAEILEDLVR